MLEVPRKISQDFDVHIATGVEDGEREPGVHGGRRAERSAGQQVRASVPELPSGRVHGGYRRGVGGRHVRQPERADRRERR